MTYSAYPRLDAWGANRRMEELVRATPTERREMAAPTHPRMFFHPTATRMLEARDLLDIRERSLTATDGLPDSFEGRRQFDARIGAVFAGLVDLAPAEGGRDETWHFLSLVLLPDLVFWRWPAEPGGRPRRDRWLGGHRNALRRLWWRHRLLGPDLVAFLSEDELVGITERPGSVGSCPHVARAYGNVLRSAVDKLLVPGPMREDVSRAFARNVSRRGAVLVLPALSEDRLESVLRQELMSARRAVLGDRTRPLPGRSTRWRPGQP